MVLLIHRICAFTAALCIVIFFSATILVEMFGAPSSIVITKHAIVWPGLVILVPAIALSGMSGFALATKRKGALVEQKKKRMPYIALNGLLVLMPCALLLNFWAAKGNFNMAFYAVQSIELLFAGVNLALIGRNIVDGRKLRHGSH